MNLVIFALTVGLALGQYACPDTLHQRFAGIREGDRRSVLIKTYEKGDTWMTITPYQVSNHGSQPWGLTAKMNMDDCSAVFSMVAPGQNDTEKLEVKAYVEFDAAVVPGGMQRKVVIRVLDPSGRFGRQEGHAEKNTKGTYPVTEWIQLDGEGNPGWFKPMPGADCSHIKKRQFIVADVLNTFRTYDLTIDQKVITIKTRPFKDRHNTVAWTMDAVFDTKTCTAMLNMAPMLPGKGNMRKLTVGTLHTATSTQFPVSQTLSFELTDPTGRAAPINAPIQDDQYPINRWIVLEEVKTGEESDVLV